MGKLVANIVLTGGPCAGKTTTIVGVKEYLESMGYHVLLLNECATELINAGIRPFGINSVSVYDFQNEVLNLQLYKEKRYYDIIDKLPDETKCIILSDRGILDSRAYLGREKFSELVKNNKLIENELGKQYDLVIHLVTVATDIKNKYNTSTNTARFEDADGAIDIDQKTINAWKDHKNIRLVEATDIIDSKVLRVKEIIKNFLDGIN